jgi:hypothetical protein
MEHDDDIADRDNYPTYLRSDQIGAMELSAALSALVLLGNDPFLRMQANNLSVVDHFIMDLEYETLRKLLDEERTPVPEVMFLSAQSQMWIFAAYELLRTWRQQAKEVLKWSRSGGLKTKLAVFEKDQGYTHVGRKLRATKLLAVLDNPSLVQQIHTDMRISHIPFRRTEFIRIALAKHEVAGEPNSVAYAPGYGRINQWCGSLDYQTEKSQVILGNISRRDIADELRALNDRSNPPTDEHIASFDAFMDLDPEDPFASIDDVGPTKDSSDEGSIAPSATKS